MIMIPPRINIPRSTMSARGWAVDSKEIHYRALQEIQEKIGHRMKIKDSQRANGQLRAEKRNLQDSVDNVPRKNVSFRKKTNLTSGRYGGFIPLEVY